VQLIESLTHKPVALAFGTSGLRGLVSDMSELECYINAAGFLEFLKEQDQLAAGATVYLAGDLRDSTPRIMAVMVAAIEDSGFKVVNGGKVPTPALAYYALQHNAPCIVVTGSHIPADRNGIKFYRLVGELLKTDEPIMQQHVAKVRQAVYEASLETSAFDNSGSLKSLPVLPAVDPDIEMSYLRRYTSVFDADSFSGKQVVVYQHSAVGRDFFVNLFKALGASVVAVERSEVFIPIDTEHIRAEDQALFQKLSQEYPQAFAIISTDGDSDRPFVIDETGRFHPGDVLGAVVADYLGAKFAAVPISCNDAVDAFCEAKGVTLAHTKVGSPYVIAAMQAADQSLTPLTSWEVNGGFLLGSDLTLNGQPLKALPTRDAALPIVCALLAAQQKGLTVSELFAQLPRRFTSSSLIDNIDPDQIAAFRSLSTDTDAMQRLATTVFGGTPLGAVEQLDSTDGLRLHFASGDVIHLRPSGNAPQFRVYSNASSQVHADELANKAVTPEGYIAQLLKVLETASHE